MQTLSELRKEVYENPDLQMCSSLPLYGLIELVSRPDKPNAVRYGCLELGDVKGILLFVSPVDAIIKCREFNRNGGAFDVFPFEFVNPRGFIRDYDGWLTLYIVYGFAARNNKLLLSKGGDIQVLPFWVHRKFNLEGIEEHIHFTFPDDLSDWLNRVHRAVALPDYPSLAYEQAKSTMGELEIVASTALQVADYMEGEAHHKPVECAVFDPVESEWCFADYDTI